MLVDTSNRLLASALRFAVEPAFEQMIGESQRGFLRGRSILSNVLELEVAMQRAALDDEEAFALLFDMRAAFPSLEHAFLHKVLEELQVPAGVRAAVRALYAGQSCCLSMAGRWWEGFRITAGIRQGCPLSPLLYVLVTEPFNRQLDRMESRRGRCTFADDLAYVGARGRQAWPLLQRLFQSLAAASGLHLNVSKTVLLPLWTWRQRAAEELWTEVVPAWSRVRVAYAGTYLGFEVGPAAADTSWTAPLRKYREAVCSWVARAPGLHLMILAYNTFVLSKLQYVAQLHGIPPGWDELEGWAIRRLFPGPFQWLPPGVAHNLRDEFGMPSQLQTLGAAGPAAQLRVAYSGGDFRRRLPLDALASSLAAARRRTRAWDLDWRWQQWFDSGPVQRLGRAVEELARQGVTVQAALDEALGNGPRPATLKAWKLAQRRLQSAASTLLRRRHWLRHGLGPFDSKVRRWRVPALLPGRRATRCRLVMKQLPKKTPPRVRAAVLRTWLGGWCTSRRFGQRGGHCAFGCRQGEDSLPHYVSCPRLWKFGVDRMGMGDPGNSQDRTAKALLWDGAAGGEALAKAATLLAVGYKAYNTLRHWRPSPGRPALDIDRLFREALRQAQPPPAQRATSAAAARRP